MFASPSRDITYHHEGPNLTTLVSISNESVTHFNNMKLPQLAAKAQASKTSSSLAYKISFPTYNRSLLGCTIGMPNKHKSQACTECVFSL